MYLWMYMCVWMDGLGMCLGIVDGGSGLRVTGGVEEFGDKPREFSSAFRGGGGRGLSKECTKSKVSVARRIAQAVRCASLGLRSAHHTELFLMGTLALYRVCSTGLR